MISLIPYIGGKHRIAKQIAVYLHATGKDTLVDVFGGSAAVLLNAGFSKRIYNDADGDLVNLFRVLADPVDRRSLIRKLRWTPPSRAFFIDGASRYFASNFSFAEVLDPVHRAALTFYRQQFCFGGKGRSGGFSVSVGDRDRIKEVFRYRNALRRLVRIGQFFRETLIENLDCFDCIAIYGAKTNVVLFIDPPYVGTEKYYARSFRGVHHAILANQLLSIPAAVVCTYYDCPEIRELYPRDRWDWHSIQATKNCQFRGGQKAKTQEMILVKRISPSAQNLSSLRPQPASPACRQGAGWRLCGLTTQEAP